MSVKNPDQSAPAILSVCRASVAYGDRVIIPGVSVDIASASFTVIVGANGCGKSTLLRTLANLLRPKRGEVSFRGKNLRQFKPRQLAKQISFLPQGTSVPAGISVVDLVARGRYPHQSSWRRWSLSDEQAVSEALLATGLRDLSNHRVDELSGGQRQRVLVAMVLAQQTEVMLLDEPTTYLDITHQYEILGLVNALRARGKTLVVVLHDLNQAARYASHLIVMSRGEIIAQGHPQKILTPELIREAFRLDCELITDPISHTPLVIPKLV